MKTKQSVSTQSSACEQCYYFVRQPRSLLAWQDWSFNNKLPLLYTVKNITNIRVVKSMVYIVPTLCTSYGEMGFNMECTSLLELFVFNNH